MWSLGVSELGHRTFVHLPKARLKRSTIRPIAIVILCIKIRQFYFAHFVINVWLSGNAWASINVVALRQTRLVSGWVTVCGRVNHLGM